MIASGDTERQGQAKQIARRDMMAGRVEANDHWQKWLRAIAEQSNYSAFPSATTTPPHVDLFGSLSRRDGALVQQDTKPIQERVEGALGCRHGGGHEEITAVDSGGWDTLDGGMYVRTGLLLGAVFRSRAHQDSTLRPRIWKVLLRVRDVSAESFLEYVGRGPCEVREKIRNDTFR